MPLSTDRFFRRVWLANGVLGFVLLLGLIGMLGYSLLEGLWSTDERGVRPSAKRSPSSNEVRPRAIRYDQPVGLVNSDWMLVQVHYGVGYGEPSDFSLGPHMSTAYRDYRSGGPVVNVIFLPPDGGPGRLLLNRPAYIRELDFPEEPRRYPDQRVDSVPWITYAIAFEDTDRSGRLDRDDVAELYISDLDGGRFRRVLPPGLRHRSTRLLPGRKLLVTALDARGDGSKPEEDQLPQRAFRFNPRTGELVSDAVLDSLAGTAGRILGR
jgi:hypothetical protein